MEEKLVANGGWKKYLTERNGRIDGGEWWMEKVPNRQEWKKLLRTVRNRSILHMPVELRNE